MFRLQTYKDQENALRKALKQVRRQSPRYRLIQSAILQLSIISKKDARLGQIRSQGAAGALAEQR